MRRPLCTILILVLQTALFYSFPASIGGTPFASYFRHLRQNIKRLVKPPSGCSSSNSELTDELQNIIVRMSEAERKRLLAPLNETIVDIEKSIIANESLSDERKVAYSGYKLNEFIKKHVRGDDESFVFRRIGMWGSVIDFILFRHILNLEAVVTIISADPKTKVVPLQAALETVLANNVTSDQKKKMEEGLTKLFEVTTPFPKRLSDFYGCLSDFLGENGSIAESVEVNGYGPLKFYSEALEFYEEVNKFDNVVKEDNAVLLETLSKRMSSINEEDLSESYIAKIETFKSRLTEFYTTNTSVTALAERFIDQMWKLFTSTNRGYYIFHYIGRDIYTYLHVAVFRENYTWGEDNSTSLKKPDSADHVNCSGVFDLLTPNAQKQTIFVESIVRDAIDPLPEGQLRNRLERVVALYQYAIENKKDLVKRYRECVRFTIKSGVMPLLSGVYFDSWDGNMQNFCNCKKEIIQNSQKN